MLQSVCIVISAIAADLTEYRNSQDQQFHLQLIDTKALEGIGSSRETRSGPSVDRTIGCQDSGKRDHKTIGSLLSAQIDVSGCSFQHRERSNQTRTPIQKFQFPMPSTSRPGKQSCENKLDQLECCLCHGRVLNKTKPGRIALLNIC